MRRLALLFVITGLLGFKNFAQGTVGDFLSSLNQEQLDKTIFALDDKLREDWHFFPASMLTKEGIMLKELNEVQKNFSTKCSKII